jgi:hypothetical protein
MMRLVIETDASLEIIDQFISSALNYGHVGTGWTSPMSNPMISVKAIEVTDDDGGNVRGSAKAEATTHATAEAYAREKLHPSDV